MGKAKPTLENAEILITPENSQNITKEKLISMLPKKTSIVVTDAILETIANMEQDTDLPQNLLEEELMTYTHLLGNGKGLGVEALINAVKFCNLKRNRSNVKAWAIVFPVQYDRLVREGKPIDNHVSMYNKTWLVTEIDKEMLIPVHLQWAGAFHAAMNTNIQIMQGNGGLDADGERIPVTAMVRHLAAKTVLEIAKPPETAKIDITIGETDKMMELKEREINAIENMVTMQQDNFRKGGKSIDVQVVHKRLEKQSLGRPDEGLNDV